MKEKKEISQGVFESFRPDGSKLITGRGWSTHIHEGSNWFSIRIEKTDEDFKGFKSFNDVIDDHLPDWMKKV